MSDKYAEEYLSNWTKMRSNNSSDTSRKFFLEENDPPHPIWDFHDYDGTDIALHDDKLCINCEKKFGSLKCSRCKLIRYCSRECQLSHFKEHKHDCKIVHKLNEKIKAYEIALRGGPIAPWDDNTYFGGIGGRERMNFYDYGNLGSWWPLLDPRNYCRTVHQLAEHIDSINWDLNIQELWEKSTDLNLELCRVNVGDNQGRREQIPSYLLYLNRDDEAFQFIKWWTYDYSEKYRSGGEPLWEKGEFRFSEAGGTRFDDLCIEINSDGSEIEGFDFAAHGVPDHAVDSYGSISNSYSLQHLVAMLVIKMRVISKLKTQEKIALQKTKIANDTSRLSIRQYLGIDHQIDLFNKYCTIINQTNKYMLHLLSAHGDTNEAVRYVDSQPYPQLSSFGSVEEAFFAYKNHSRHVARTLNGYKQVEAYVNEHQLDQKELDFTFKVYGGYF